MSATVSANNRWQPSILHVLPFSKNDTTTVPSALMPSQNRVSYSKKELGKLPVLAFTKSDVEAKYRTKSAFSSNSESSKTVSVHKTRHRILTASSDQLLTRHSHDTSNQHEVNPETKAQVNDKIMSNTFKVSANEADNHTDEDSRNVVSDQSSIGNSDVCKEIYKSLPKPVFKPAECPMFYKSTKHLAKSHSNNMEGELERQKRNLSFHTVPDFQKSRRLKLNVNDLPRSKTPIVETDPDKLNMKHVIAFLQSRNKVQADDDYDHDWNMNSSVQCSVKPPSQVPKRLTLSSAQDNTDKNRAFFDQKQQVIKIRSGSNEPNSTPTIVSTKEITSHYRSTRPASYNDINSKIVKHDSELSVKTRRQSAHDANTHYQLSEGDNFVKQRKKTKTVDKSKHLDQRSELKSLATTEPCAKVKDGHMYKNISKLHSKNMETPYRLHRPASPEPTWSETLMSISDKSLQEDVAGIPGNSAAAFRSLAVVVNDNKSSEPFMKSRNEFPLPLSGTGVSKNTLLNRPEKRSDLNCVQICNIENEQTWNVNNVINLPSAQLEEDSDEDILSVSVTARVENKQELTRSMNGCDVRGAHKIAFSKNAALAQENLSNYNGQEPIIKVPVKEVNKNVMNQPQIEYELESKHPETKQIKSDPLPNNFKEKLISDTGRSPKGPALNTEDKTTKEATLNSVQLKTHQETFTRLLNQELATRTRTSTWLEHQNNLFSPFVNGNKQPSDVRNSASPREVVRLSLRKERNKTRVHTYMVDMEVLNNDQ